MKVHDLLNNETRIYSLKQFLFNPKSCNNCTIVFDLYPFPVEISEQDRQNIVTDRRASAYSDT